jgi:hypothetical protein
MQRPITIQKVLYKLFPDLIMDFAEIQLLRSSHYDKRLEKISFPKIQNDFQETMRLKIEKEANAAIKNGISQVEIVNDLYTEMTKTMLLHLGQSYLVKSCSMIEGFILSLNMKNAYLMALCIRQEMEILAHSHYANYITSNDYKGVNYFDELRRLLFGSMSPSNPESDIDHISAIHVLTTIRHYDEDLTKQSKNPWIEDGYKWLSEFVHPNSSSNYAHFNKGQHYWFMDFAQQADLLKRFLGLASKSFSETIDEIWRIIDREDFECGLRFNLSPKK